MITTRYAWFLASLFVIGVALVAGWDAAIWCAGGFFFARTLDTARDPNL